VRDFIHGKENYYFKWLTATEYVLLIFLAILPLMLVFFTYNLKKSTGSLGLEERFKEIADPKTASPEEAYKHALALIDLGKQNKALELLNSVIGSGKFKSDALLQRGKLLFELKNYEEAASDLETYLESKPRTLSEQPFLVLIESYRALEEWENVLEVVNDMHRKFSTNMQSWYSKTEAYIKLKDKDSATKAVDEMMEKWNEVPSYMQPQEKEWMQKGKKLHSAIKLLEK
jgi:tetratricopeptide (TPR) repeat protein